MGLRDPSATLRKILEPLQRCRISKSLNGTTYARYVYDGNRLIEERDGSGTLVTSYVYGNGVDEVLTRRRTSGGVTADLFYHTNALGSVTAVTDALSGAVVERYKYDAYGNPTFLTPGFGSLTSSTVMNNVLFTGRYYDVESGLYHYRARAYHPVLGRFLQRDPLGERASLNLYTYARNSPTNFVDPSGMTEYKKVTDADIREGMGQFWDDVNNMSGDVRTEWHLDGSWQDRAMRQADLGIDRIQTLEARKELGLPAGDPRQGMNGDGSQGGNLGAGSNPHISITTQGRDKPFQSFSEHWGGSAGFSGEVPWSVGDNLWPVRSMQATWGKFGESLPYQFGFALYHRLNRLRPPPDKGLTQYRPQDPAERLPEWRPSPNQTPPEPGLGLDQHAIEDGAHAMHGVMTFFEILGTGALAVSIVTPVNICGIPENAAMCTGQEETDSGI